MKVFNIEASVYNIQNCLEAIRLFAQSSLRTAVGKMELQEILDNRNLVNQKVISDLKSDLEYWGFAITRCEISNIEAKDSRVKKALNDQINAEQISREKHIQADSYFAATKNKTEGEYFQMMKEADA